MSKLLRGPFWHSAGKNVAPPNTRCLTRPYSFASLPQAQAPELRPLWAQVLQTISRHASSAAAGRAACHLIHIMIRQQLVGVTESHPLWETLLGGGLGGPGSVTDSALELFTVMLQQRGSSSLIAWELNRDKTLSWINTSWHLRLSPPLPHEAAIISC